MNDKTEGILVAVNKIRGREVMNRNTASVHPDPQVRAMAEARAEANAMALDDIYKLTGVRHTAP